MTEPGHGLAGGGKRHGGLGPGLRSQGTFAVLYWHETARQWVEIDAPLERQEIPEALLRTTGDELYRLFRNEASVFFPVLTTDKTGIFVLVSK